MWISADLAPDLTRSAFPPCLPQMDVEGNEPFVMEGAQQLLQKRNVWFIV